VGFLLYICQFPEMHKLHATFQCNMLSPEEQLLLGVSVRIPNLSGLHARPAATFAARAKKFASTIRLVKDTDSVNAKSVVAIMGLGSQFGDCISVQASGPDAAEAVQVLTELLASGCGESHSELPTESHQVSAPVSIGTATRLGQLPGVPASSGLAVGRIVQFRHADVEVPETGGSPVLERMLLKAALQESSAQIDALMTDLGKTESKILSTHQELLEDPDLLKLAADGIELRKSAGFAWRAAFMQYATQLESLQGNHNAMLRERGNDIRDIGHRVLGRLVDGVQSNFELPDGAILIAPELSPSDTASFDRSKLMGFCTTTGGPTSHVAILAKSFGIPALCSIDESALDLEDGTLVVLDGTNGLLNSQPTAADLERAQADIIGYNSRSQQDRLNANALAVTQDGCRIEVVANVRNAQEAIEGVANGAEGVGLLRSEFLFDTRDSTPSEDEQAIAYAAVANALGPERPLVVRTLDVGGDKPLSYLPIPKEENPFLGMRGVRVSLDQPALFRTQLRAIQRCAGLAKLHIMFPMVATLEELREAKLILAEERSKTNDHDIQVGLMIEVPSAAVLSEQFAKEADFFSIGTNDLTQYTLAMDRGHPKLAQKADGLHPAVLKMIALTCEGALKHGRWVGVCGGLASDLLAIPVLIGLGAVELSVSVPDIPAVKALIHRLSIPECKVLAQEVIQMGTATEVRARLTAFANTKR
jgi:phosphocarrier protein FPr/phosphocarrier protein